MNLNLFNDPFLEIIIGLNYLVQIFIFQIGFLFIKQWYDGFKKELSNKIVLSYGFYYLSLAISLFINSYSYYQEISSLLFNEILILSAVIRFIGGITFSITIERYFQRNLRTKFLFSIFFTISLSLIPFFINTTYFYQIIDIFNLFYISLPIIFSIYFIENSFSQIKKKLRISLIGIILLFFSLFFNSERRLNLIQEIFSNSSYIIIGFKLMGILGIFLFSSNTIGLSFSLETQWQKNLISLYIIHKKRNICLYYKDFSESEIKNEEVFAGGISGVEKIIKQFTDSKKDLNVIHMENNIIQLEFGEEIIAAMILKKNLSDTRIVLKEITKMFEFYFWDYLKNADFLADRSELFKPMEIIIRKLIKL